MDVVFHCVKSGTSWNPEFGGGGGAEQALRLIAFSLATRGLCVTVYSGDIDNARRVGGVLWRPISQWDDPGCDIIIMWRYPTLLRANSVPRCKKLLLDLHEAINPEILHADLVDYLTGLLFKSSFHRQLYPDVPEQKSHVIPNAVETELFLRPAVRNPYLMLNTAFPVRSLAGLVYAFRIVKSLVPEAELVWAYGWRTYDIFYRGNLRMMSKKFELRSQMRDLEIIELGFVDALALTDLYLKANLYVYPSQALEVDCMSISKAQLAGAVPVATTFAALGNKRSVGGIFLPADRCANQVWDPEWQLDDSISPGPLLDKWIDAVCGELLHPKTEEERDGMRQLAATQYSVDTITRGWLQVISSALDQ